MKAKEIDVEDLRVGDEIIALRCEGSEGDMGFVHGVVAKIETRTKRRLREHTYVGSSVRGRITGRVVEWRADAHCGHLGDGSRMMRSIVWNDRPIFRVPRPR